VAFAAHPHIGGWARGGPFRPANPKELLVIVNRDDHFRGRRGLVARRGNRFLQERPPFHRIRRNDYANFRTDSRHCTILHTNSGPSRISMKRGYVSMAGHRGPWRTPVLLSGAGPPRRWRAGLAPLAQGLSAAEKACKVTPSLLSWSTPIRLDAVCISPSSESARNERCKRENSALLSSQ